MDIFFLAHTKPDLKYLVSQIQLSGFPDSVSVRLNHRWKDSIEMDHEQGGRVWTGLNVSVDWDRWQACVIVVMNLGSYKLQASS